MIGLGSYGSYVIIRELVEAERIFSIRQILSVLLKRWYAACIGNRVHTLLLSAFHRVGPLKTTAFEQIWLAGG